MISKKAILIVNLGSPDKLAVNEIRKFLRKFLSDPKVVRLPKVVWYPILYLIILPFRGSKLLSKYKQIWHYKSNSSPLVEYTNAQQHKLESLYKKDNSAVLIKHAFCYSTPEIKAVVADIHKDSNINELIVLPLYPQFSSTTTTPIFRDVANFYLAKNCMPTIKFIRGFATHESYIEAIVNLIKDHLKQNPNCEKLVFSYHSLPQTIIDNGDSYYTECLDTSSLIAKSLALDQSQYVVAFQSKFGSQKWIQPATSDMILGLARSGIKNIAVICPGFISDCLETLEEINILNREVFMTNGGLNYQYIPCLNDSLDSINMLKQIINDNLNFKPKD